MRTLKTEKKNDHKLYVKLVASYRREQQRSTYAYTPIYSTLCMPFDMYISKNKEHYELNRNFENMQNIKVDSIPCWRHLWDNSYN